MDTKESKKLRLGDEEFKFSDERHEKITSPYLDNIDDYSDCDDDDEAQKEYLKFIKEYNVNLGFDIETFVPIGLGGTMAVRALDICDESDWIYLHCVKAVRSVLKYLDEQKEHSLELVKIIRANYRAMHKFFATFDARDKNTGAIQTYQSMVYRNFLDFETILYIFKKEGEPIDKEEEEVVPVFSDERAEYKFEEFRGTITSSCGTEAFKQKAKKYIQELNESEGFEIEHFVGSVRPVSRAEKDVFSHCTEAVMTVLDHLKKSGELNLELLRVIKANFKCRPGNLYYVTFEAKNENSGEIEIYQSVIYHECYSSSVTELDMLRKIKGKVVPTVEDLRDEYEFGKAKTIGIADLKTFSESNDSEGRHIYTKPERGSTGTELFEDCEMALKDVLEYLSLKDKKELKLVKITTAKYEEQLENDESNYTFFITFQAKNKDSELTTYQSVITIHSYEQIKLHMFGKEKCC